MTKPYSVTKIIQNFSSVLFSYPFNGITIINRYYLNHPYNSINNNKSLLFKSPIQ